MPTKDTGHGATIVFGTSLLAYSWRKISECTLEGPEVEDTSLANATYQSFLPGDLPDPGEFEIEYCWGAKTALPTLRVVETITLTFPQAVGGATKADIEGTGYIRSRTAFPEMATNGLQIGKMKVAWDGAGGIRPVLTLAT